MGLYVLVILEETTYLEYPDLGVLVHANGLQQIFASVVDGLNEGLTLGVDEALELHAGFLITDEIRRFSRIADFFAGFPTYRDFVAHAFEPLDELGRGTCLLRQLLQIV